MIAARQAQVEAAKSKINTLSAVVVKLGRTVGSDGYDPTDAFSLATELAALLSTSAAPADQLAEMLPAESAPESTPPTEPTPKAKRHA